MYSVYRLRPHNMLCGYLTFEQFYVNICFRKQLVHWLKEEKRKKWVTESSP
jgi:hypothetical protein